MGSFSLGKKTLLVSREFQHLPHTQKELTQIARYADSLGCHTVSFALFTYCTTTDTKPLTHDLFFKNTKTLETVILEIGNLKRETDIHTELWQRSSKDPRKLIRQFAVTTERRALKIRLMEQIKKGERTFDGKSLVLICGESNGIFVMKEHRYVVDEFNLAHRLVRMRTKVVFNNLHDYQSRPECAAKRKYLSLSGRAVLSVWNMNSEKRRQARNPWSLFINGENQSQKIQEIENLFERKDLRLAVVDL